MIRKYGLYFAWVTAAIGTMASLYFSEIKNFEPCHLCWYQRMCLFPLFIILGIAVHNGFLGIVRYVLPQVILGFLFALYQVAIQEIPGWNPIDICGAGPSCSEKIPIGLGFITIPMLSALGFFFVGVTLTAVWVSNYRYTRLLSKLPVS